MSPMCRVVHRSDAWPGCPRGAVRLSGRGSSWPCAVRGGLSRGDTPAVSVVRLIGRLAGVSPSGCSVVGKREFLALCGKGWAVARGFSVLGKSAFHPLGRPAAGHGGSLTVAARSVAARSLLRYFAHLARMGRSWSAVIWPGWYMRTIPWASSRTRVGVLETP